MKHAKPTSSIAAATLILFGVAAACASGDTQTASVAKNADKANGIDSDALPSVQVNVKLKNERILLGEPIILEYAVETESSKPLKLPFEQKTPWFHVELRNRDGKVLAASDRESVRGASVQAAQTRFNQYQRTDFFFVGKNRPLRDTIVIGDARLPLTEAGDYQIVVQAKALWSPLAGSFGRFGMTTSKTVLYYSTSDREDARHEKPRIVNGSIRAIDLPRSVLAQAQSTEYPPEWAVNARARGQWDKELPLNKEFVLPLKVERNPAKIVKKAQQLGEEILSGPVSTKRAAVQELFALNGRSAQKVQLALLDALAGREDKTDFGTLISEITRINTPEAIDFVARYIWNVMHTQGDGGLAKAYFFADHDIQDRIAEQLAKHNQRLPQRPILD